MLLFCFTLNTRKRLFCFVIMQKMELNNKSTKNNIYVSIYLSVLNFQVRTPVPLHREKKEDMFKIKTGASTMLSLAAIAAWAFIENITYQRHLFGTKKDVYNGSSILQYKRGRSSSSFPFKKSKQRKKKKKKTTFCAATFERAASPFSSPSSSVLLQHALDSLVG